MIFHSISDYLIPRYQWKQTPITITPDGKVFSFINGEWKEGMDFDKPIYQRIPPSNPDGKFLNLGVVPRKGQR